MGAISTNTFDSNKKSNTADSQSLYKKLSKSAIDMLNMEETTLPNMDNLNFNENIPVNVIEKEIPLGTLELASEQQEFIELQKYLGIKQKISPTPSNIRKNSNQEKTFPTDENADKIINKSNPEVKVDSIDEMMERSRPISSWGKRPSTGLSSNTSSLQVSDIINNNLEIITKSIRKSDIDQEHILG